MRRALVVPLLLALAGCGQPDSGGDRTRTNQAEPPPAATPEPAAPPPRYVGRWAAKLELCRDGAWDFQERHLSTAGEVSCDFDRVDEAQGGYDIAATCLAEGNRAPDRIKLRFAESAGAMLVESKSFAPPVGLIRCDGRKP